MFFYNLVICTIFNYIITNKKTKDEVFNNYLITPVINKSKNNNVIKKIINPIKKIHFKFWESHSAFLLKTILKRFLINQQRHGIRKEIAIIIIIAIIAGDEVISIGLSILISI
ncbi:MAG: hypothetical protein ACRDBR_02405 [Metamycoplasmataceae bacterium]